MQPVLMAAEGDTDLAVARAILQFVGLEPGQPFNCGGKKKLDDRLGGFQAAARHAPWLVLRDLDHDAPCAGMLVQHLVPQPVQQLCLRIPVRAVEAWLLADAERMASFLHVQMECGRLARCTARD